MRIHFLLTMSIALLIPYLMLAQVHPSVDQVYQKFSQAYATYDLELMKSIYAEDALYLNPGTAILEGHVSFLLGFEQLFRSSQERGDSLNISFKFVKRMHDAGRAYDVGYFKLQIIPMEGQPEISVGKFITILEPNEQGDWVFVVDGYNTAPVKAFEKIQ